MAKRLRDTEMWKKQWFRELSPTWKCFIDYILANCDCAGIWDVDFAAASFYINAAVSEADMPDIIADKLSLKKISASRWFISEFIPFQYGEIGEKSKMFPAIRRQLEKYGIDTASILYPDCIDTVLDKDKDKRKNKEKEKEGGVGETTFDDFWAQYPKKVGKGDARKAWKKVLKPKETLVLIFAALEWQKKTEQWTKNGGQFIPNPSTYINQQRWLDEPVAAPKRKTLLEQMNEIEANSAAE